MRRVVLGLMMGAALLMTLSACGKDKDTDSGSATAVEVAAPWARSSPMNAANGAAYMVLTAPEADKLVAASVDPKVAAKVELHETVAATGSMTSSTTMGGGEGTGAMEMRPVAAIDLPAEQAVKLEPGGYHVMLLDLATPLTTGTSFELTLTFEKGGAQTVSVPVRDDAP